MNCGATVLKVFAGILIFFGVSAKADFGPNIYWHVRMAECDKANRKYTEAVQAWVNCTISKDYCVGVTVDVQQACRNAEAICYGVTTEVYECGAFNF